MGRFLDSILNAERKEAEEFERREQKRQEYLANAGGLDNKIADFVARQLPEGTKISSKQPNKVSAVDAAFDKEDPRRDMASTMRRDVDELLRRPEYAGVDPERVFNIVGGVHLKDREEDVNRYTRKAESNMFGLAPKAIRRTDNYSQWLAAQREQEDQLLDKEYETTGADIALNAGVGAAAGGLFGGPLAAAAGGAVGAAMTPVYNTAAKWMQGTEWARARQQRGEWDRTDALEATGMLGLGFGVEGPAAGKLVNAGKMALAAKAVRNAPKVPVAPATIVDGEQFRPRFDQDIDSAWQNAFRESADDVSNTGWESVARPPKVNTRLPADTTHPGYLGDTAFEEAWAGPGKWRYGDPVASAESTSGNLPDMTPPAAKLTQLPDGVDGPEWKYKQWLLKDGVSAAAESTSAAKEVIASVRQAARRPTVENLVAVSNADDKAKQAFNLFMQESDKSLPVELLKNKGVDITTPDSFFSSKLTKEAQDAISKTEQIPGKGIQSLEGQTTEVGQGLEAGIEAGATKTDEVLDAANDEVKMLLDEVPPAQEPAVSYSKKQLEEAGLLDVNAKNIGNVLKGAGAQEGADSAFAVKGYLEILNDPTSSESLLQIARENLPKAWEQLQKSTFRKISSFDEGSINLVVEQVSAGKSPYEAIKYAEATRAVKSNPVAWKQTLTDKDMAKRFELQEQLKEQYGMSVRWNEVVGPNGKVAKTPALEPVLESNPGLKKASISLNSVLEPHADEIKALSAGILKQSTPTGLKSTSAFDRPHAGSFNAAGGELSEELLGAFRRIVADPFAKAELDTAVVRSFDLANKGEPGGAFALIARKAMQKIAADGEAAVEKSADDLMEEMVDAAVRRQQAGAGVAKEVAGKLTKFAGRLEEGVGEKLASVLPFSVLPIAMGMLMLDGASPQDVEAGVASSAVHGAEQAFKSGGIVGDFWKALTTNATTYTDFLKAAGYAPPAVEKGQLRIGERMKTLEIKPMTGMTKEESFPRRLLQSFQDKISPHYAAELYYPTEASPAVELAHKLQGASWDSRVSMQVFNNIKELIPGMSKKETRAAFRDVRESMKPLADRYADVVVPYSYHKATAESAKKAVERLEVRIGKIIESEASPTELKRLKKLKEGLIQRKKELLEKDELFKQQEPAYLEYKKLWTEKMQVLASKHASTRVALALEDTKGELYPWLKGMMTESERAGVVHLKAMMDDFAGRIKSVGGKTLEKDFVHHAIHPDVDMKKVGLMYNDLAGGNTAAAPLSKLHHRMKDSLQLVPETDWVMERYLPDINKRIAVMDFWGQRGSGKWLDHRKSFEVINNKGLDKFWKSVEDGFKPIDDQPLNKLADRYTKMEVLRLLAFSPSVAFKHGIKLAATFAENPGQFLTTAPQAVKTSLKIIGKEILPEKLGRKITLNEVDSFVDSQIRVQRMMDSIADFAPYELRQDVGWNKIGNVFDRFTDKAADVTGALVKSTELFDRAMTVLSSAKYGATHGMTPHQAMYAMMKGTLENNFLAGEMNPSWLRDPKIRAFLMFQGTPFKILERRMKLLYKSGGEITAGSKELVRQVQDVKRSMVEGERLLKMELIKDAFQSKKDLFGRTNSGILMREMLILGAMVSGGAEFLGSDLGAHAFHLPFVKADDQGDAQIAMNPFLASVYRTLSDKDEEPEFWLSEFFKDYFKGGVFPSIVNKGLNLTTGDIPETYRTSKFPEINYLFAVPGKGEH